MGLAAGSSATSVARLPAAWSGSFRSLPSGQRGGPVTATVLPCDSSGCPWAVGAEAGTSPAVVASDILP